MRDKLQPWFDTLTTLSEVDGESTTAVIPRVGGESSLFNLLQIFWTPVFTGVTTFYEYVNIKSTPSWLIDDKE
jgi:hypothetical protein